MEGSHGLNLDHERNGTEVNGLGASRGNTKEEGGDGKVSWHDPETPNPNCSSKKKVTVFPS